MSKQMEAAPDRGHSGEGYSERLLVKIGGRVAFIRVEEIEWIEAQGNYLRLHKDGDSYLVRQTMNEMESILNPRLFLRIHRSTIVNSERIKDVHPLLHGDYEVVLMNGMKLTLSRNHAERIQQFLENVFRFYPKKPLQPGQNSV